MLYFVQIYCDFSGYSDMAIGVAALLGYTLPLNFAFPIFARSITQFWRRWHISLSSWFRDYLYIPLGGSRGGRASTYRNLWLVFCLCALWHGAAWTFVVWGSLHGLILVLERAFRMSGRLERNPLGYVWTFLLANFAWVFFRATSISNGADYLAGMFGAGSGEQELRDLSTIAWFLGTFLVLHLANYVGGLEERFSKLPAPLYAILYGALFAILLPIVSTEYQPFIYFQF